MSEIKVELKYWSGDDLAVIAAAKESFNRKAEWEFIELHPSENDCIHIDSMKKQGWEYLGNDKYRRLKMRDQDLLRMLARGMGQKEYQSIVEDIGATNGYDEIERLLWKFRHTTPHLAPFGHCFATFRFRAPVFVMRHIVKHEYIRISELSMRYVRGMPEYFKPKSWRAVAEDVKQGSALHDVEDPAFYFDHLEECYRRDARQYSDDLHFGLCPEQARTFLRLCHMTEGTLSGSMDAIAGIVIKRLDPHAQEETREFARQIDHQMFGPYPKSWEALTEGVHR